MADISNKCHSNYRIGSADYNDLLLTFCGNCVGVLYRC